MAKRARIIIEVVAGIIPGTPIPDYTKQFVIDSDMWYAQGEWKEKEQEAAAKCKEIQQQALDYQTTLWNPGAVNWVKTEWLYL